MAGAALGVRVEGVSKFLTAMQKVDSRFNAELRKAAMDVAGDVATRVGARGSGPQARVFGALAASSDRYPTIRLKGANSFRRKRKGRTGAKMSDIFFGAEFGSNRYKQFHRPHAGTRGYVFWPTVRAMSGEIAHDYLNAVERVLDTLGGVDD